MKINICKVFVKTLFIIQFIYKLIFINDIILKYLEYFKNSKLKGKYKYLLNIY